MKNKYSNLKSLQNLLDLSLSLYFFNIKNECLLNKENKFKNEILLNLYASRVKNTIFVQKCRCYYNFTSVILLFFPGNIPEIFIIKVSHLSNH